MDSNNTTVIVSNCVAFISAVPQYQKKYFAVAFGINAVFATSFNILVFVAYLKSTALRKWSYYLIMSLALGDLLVGLILSPITVLQVASLRSGNCFINKLGSFMVSLLATSALTISVISYDRYKRINGIPIERATFKTVCIYFVLPWSSPLLLVITKFGGSLVFTVSVLAVFAVVYGLLLYSYMKLIRLLKLLNISANPQLNIMKQRNTKAVNFILFLSAIFVVLSVGIFLYRTLKLINILSNGFNYIFSNAEREATTIAIGQFLFQFNSSINPIIYFIKIPKLRRFLVLLIRNNRTGAAAA